MKFNINYKNIFKYLVLPLTLFNSFFYFRFLLINNYLPAPFHIDKDDTLMDFYNPLFWVIKDEFYSTFNSVYPALNYYILKIFESFAITEGFSNAKDLRFINNTLTFDVVLIYISLIFISLIISRPKVLSNNLLFLFLFIIVFSFPVLYAIERGNLIIFCLPFLAIFITSNSTIIRSINLAILINLKPYFIFLLIGSINKNKNDYKLILYSFFLSLTIFTYLGIMAKIDFFNFFQNYFLFSNSTSIAAESKISLTNSISSLHLFKNFTGRYQLFGFESSFRFWYSFLIFLNMLTILILIILSYLKNISRIEYSFIGIAIITNISSSFGGYILILYIPMILIMLKEQIFNKYIILIIIIFWLPLDFLPILKIDYGYMNSFFLDGLALKFRPVDLEIGLGSFFRPLANYLILIILIKSILKKNSC
jgi:hypothetical protein